MGGTAGGAAGPHRWEAPRRGRYAPDRRRARGVEPRQSTNRGAATPPPIPPADGTELGTRHGERGTTTTAAATAATAPQPRRPPTGRSVWRPAHPLLRLGTPHPLPPVSCGCDTTKSGGTMGAPECTPPPPAGPATCRSRRAATPACGHEGGGVRREGPPSARRATTAAAAAAADRRGPSLRRQSPRLTWTAVLLVALLIAAMLAGSPADGAAKGKGKGKGKGNGKGKAPACPPAKCMTKAKVNSAIDMARKRLVTKEKVPAKRAAQIKPLVLAVAKTCKSGGKPVSPPTYCFPETPEAAFGGAYAAALRKFGKHVTKSTPFGVSKKKGLSGCAVCEPYYFSHRFSCCYIGCTSLILLVGSSTIYLDGCCRYLHGRCLRSAEAPSSGPYTLWSGF
ncbi:hypothetical protein BU14_0852s0002 [Porphyra umbilicalis]|uniref:Uncharacterized protein n=1 Tax=Porphyra umbilicalis TaxID=2786 RepID=A0A1X6NNQ5_PORUM|nr:hypothetical protein BU14_0852s0002 [Porphyra umbilicalis]|eukprot:OSX70217.1 hypothetical protein BU14_0852s0002 [Porphyra umbilicalis]